MHRVVLRGARAVLGPQGRAFARALAEPELAQAAVRRDVARALANTEYGRSLGVRGDAEDFSARVPVRSWDELTPWIERQRAEEGRIITAEQVLFYEKTSGSTGPVKYVPYTATLRRTFSRMFMAWSHDVLGRGPPLKSGRLYFSVSPRFTEEPATVHGVAVGTEDDRDYLEGWLRPLLKPFIVTPPGLGRERDPQSFLRRLSRALLEARDLEIISVWSPSLLLVVLEFIAAHRDLLADGLPAPQARALRVVDDDWTALWPSLALISCWDRGGAAPYAARLRAMFPGVLLQGKGLLATEAPVTIPWLGAPAPVPLINDVLVELEDASGVLRPLLDAEDGAEYRVVVSPRGGLPRYALGDRVQARGRQDATPCLEFVGRSGGVSDLVGEKLSEGFVVSVLARLALPADAPAVLVPVRQPRDHYLLLVDAPQVPSDTATRLEALLAEGHHYQHARLLGQLTAVQVHASRGAGEWVTEQLRRRGIDWGNIKPTALLTAPADDVLLQRLAGARA